MTTQTVKAPERTRAGRSLRHLYRHGERVALCGYRPPPGVQLSDWNGKPRGDLCNVCVDLAKPRRRWWRFWRR